MTLADGRLRLVGGGLVVGLVVTGLALVASNFWLFLLTSMLTTHLLARSVGIVFGVARMVSLCQVSFAGVAGWVVGWLSLNTTLAFEVQLALAVLAVIPVGIVIGLPALRLRGINLAVVTLGFATAASILLFNRGFPGVTTGKSVARPTLVGDSDAALFVFVAVLVVATELVLRWLDHRRLGASWRSVAHSERTTAALGLSVARTKLSAFAISAGVAALAGGLMATQIGTLSGRSFTEMTSLVMFALAVFAGAQLPLGALFAGLIFVGFPELLRVLGWPIDLAPILFAIGAIQALTQGTTGVVGGWQQALRERARRRVARQGRSPDPVATADPALNLPETTAEPGPPALTVTGLTVAYGAVTAVDSLDLSISSGSIHGLIGPNGAGKSSFIDAVSGFTPATGQVTLDGADLGHVEVAGRARQGLRRTFQRARTVPELRIAALVKLAAPHIDPQELDELLDDFGLREASTRIERLDVGQRRQLEVVVALAAAPRVVLLDEPAAGLTDQESRRMGAALLRRVDQTGLGVLLVEHDIDLVRQVCDTCTVLDRGRAIARGRPARVVEDPAVQKAYLGLTGTEVEP